MLDKSQFPLDSNSNQKFEFLPQGHPAIPTLASQIPKTWLQALAEMSQPDEAVEFLWQPLTPLARGFVFRLASITEQLGLLISPAENFPPHLCYACSAGQLGRGWIGGLPANDQYFDEWEKNNAILLPASFRQFARMHNGFLENEQGRMGIYPLRELSLSRLPIESLDSVQLAKPDAGLAPLLLSFASLNDGSQQGYNLSSTWKSKDALTLKWGHPGGGILRPQSFWSFLKDFAIQYL